MFDKLISVKNKMSINKVIESLLILTVFFIPISRSGMNIFSFFILLLWIIKKLKNRSFLKSKKQLSKWLIFYSLILFLPLLNFPSKGAFLVILDTFISTYLKYVIIFVVTIETIDDKQKYKKVLFSFLISATLVIGYGFYGILYKGYTGRLTSTFNNANPAGSYFMIISLLAFSFLLFNKNIKNKILAFVYFLLSTTLLILTYSRGAWLGYIFGIMLGMAIFIYKLDSIKFKSIITISIAIIVILSIPLLPPKVVERFKSIDNLESNSIKQRLIQYKVGFNIFRDYPFFGVGIGRFPEMFKDYRLEGVRDFRHIHNLYLNLAVETGSLGIIFLIIVIHKLIFKKMFNFTLNKESLNYGFFIICLGIFIHNLVDITFLYSMVGLNLIVIAALWFNYKLGKY